MKHLSAIIAGMFIVFASSTAWADFTINAVADGDIIRNAVGRTVDDTDTIVGTSRSSGNNVRNGIFEFDLSSIASGTTVYSATFELELRSNISNLSSTANLKIGQYNGNGTVDTDDYADFVNFAGDIEVYDTTTNGGPGNGDVLIINLDNSTIQAIVNDSGLNFLGIRTATQDFATFQFTSNEGAAVSGMAPTLTIVTVPEPSSLGLLTLGFIGVLGRRRRS